MTGRERRLGHVRLTRNPTPIRTIGHRFRGVGNPFDADPILVEVVRNGYVESVHRGRVAVTDPDGRLACSVGAEFAPMYPRSALKPLQAVGMLRAGLDLAGEPLALVCASHSGEPIHVDGGARDPGPRRAGRVGAADAAGLAAGRGRAGDLDPRAVSPRRRSP